MLKDFFYHNSTERKATILLLILVFVLILLCWTVPYVMPTTNFDFQQFKKEVAKFNEGLNETEDEELPAYTEYSDMPTKYYKKGKKFDNQTQLNPFPFNPNSADQKTLIDLGLSEKTVKAILNYREKGGVFKIKSDLSKVYSLKLEDFEVLADFIQLPDSIEKKTFSEQKKPAGKKREILPVNVNNASAEEFDKLPGIGPSFAERIVKYRDALGGFTDLVQLEEIYGMSDSTLTKIAPYLTISTGTIKKININKMGAEELKSHPYLRWRHANAIVKYREKNGPYSSVEILRSLHEFNDSEGTFWKIKPYLSI